MNIFSTFVYDPLYNGLIALYALFGNLGLAIIALTIIIKLALLGLSKQQISSQKEMQEIQPEIKKLQKKYKDDKEKLAKETMTLYKEHGINPLAGCLPLIIQMIVFITLYRVLINLLQNDESVVNSEILYSITPEILKVQPFFATLNLAEAASLVSISLLLPLATAAAQYYQIKMMQAKNAAATEPKEPSKDGQPDFATIMQKQMLVIIPLMTLIIGFTFPLGLTLYWFVSTLFMIGQQWVIMKTSQTA